MNLISRVLDAAYCNSTHHKIALDALDHLRGAPSQAWRDFLLTKHQPYLTGSKEPDKTFKDFKNHVLHVQDNYWGGAREKSRSWYDATVRALWKKDWTLAAYNAGVLSHYVVDPIMPFHTAQSEAETVIHRAAEWSIRQSYDDLREIARSRMGYPNLEPGTQAGWLDEMVTAGAEIANGYYDGLIEHYDFKKGVRDPKAGFDDDAREMLAQLIGFATISWARVLERAVIEAGVSPPQTHPTLQGTFAMLDIPFAWVAKNITNSRERGLIENQYREWKKTGTVERHLTEDVRVVRDLTAEYRRRAEADKVPLPAEAAAVASTPTPEPEKETTPSTAPSLPRRRSLGLDDDVVDAPSIGPKTTTRLNKIDIHTVRDLLMLDPAAAADAMDCWVKEDDVRDWQDQATLMVEVPNLQGHDAQILVSSGYRTPENLAESQPEEVLLDVLPFVDSTAGQRIVSEKQRPTLREAAHWIGWAEDARPLDLRQDASADPSAVELAS